MIVSVFIYHINGYINKIIEPSIKKDIKNLYTCILFLIVHKTRLCYCILSDRNEESFRIFICIFFNTIPF